MTTVAEARKDVEVPEGVTVSLDGDTVKVQGPNGNLERTFRHPSIDVRTEDGQVVLVSEFPRRKVRALIGTWASHIRNMIRGVQEDYEYNLKIVYSHFPIKAKVQGDAFVIENFLGERHPRTARIMPGAKVEVKGDDVTVKGPHLEHVGQTAANIEQATRISGYDPRVFQDGIYITQKGSKS